MTNEPLRSCIYNGYVFHRRNVVSQDKSSLKSNHFKYPISCFFIDLSELDRIFAGIPFASVNYSFNVLSFSLKNYLSGKITSAGAFRQQIDELVYLHCKQHLPDDSHICILTFPMQFGYTFNPVSTYYILNNNYTRILCVVLEVSNTPWLEKHCYILPFFNHNSNIDSTSKNNGKNGKNAIGNDNNNATQRQLLYTCKWQKAFHVSPFYDMQYLYQWTFGIPDSKLRSFGFLLRNVEKTTQNIMQTNDNIEPKQRQKQTSNIKIETHGWGTSSLAKMVALDETNQVNAMQTEETKAFAFGFEKMERKEMNIWNLISFMIYFPVVCCLAQFWIHWQAFKVFYKGISVKEHPNKVKVSFSGFWIKHTCIFIGALFGYIASVFATFLLSVASFVWKMK